MIQKPSAMEFPQSDFDNLDGLQLEDISSITDDPPAIDPTVIFPTSHVLEIPPNQGVGVTQPQDGCGSRLVGVKWIDMFVGFGLFAKEAIPKHSLVAMYFGIYRTVDEIDKLYGKTPAQNVIEITGTGMVVDASYQDFRGVATYANTSFDKPETINSQFWVEFVGIYPNVWIRTTRDVAAGEEILVDYGTEYRLPGKGSDIPHPRAKTAVVKNLPVEFEKKQKAAKKQYLANKEQVREEEKEEKESPRSKLAPLPKIAHISAGLGRAIALLALTHEKRSLSYKEILSFYNANKFTIDELVQSKSTVNGIMYKWNRNTKFKTGPGDSGSLSNSGNRKDLFRNSAWEYSIDPSRTSIVEREVSAYRPSALHSIGHVSTERVKLVSLAREQERLASKQRSKLRRERIRREKGASPAKKREKKKPQKKTEKKPPAVVSKEKKKKKVEEELSVPDASFFLEEDLPESLSMLDDNASDMSALWPSLSEQEQFGIQI